jgi:hypothetical protein
MSHLNHAVPPLCGNLSHDGAQRRGYNVLLGICFFRVQAAVTLK